MTRDARRTRCSSRASEAYGEPPLADIPGIPGIPVVLAFSVYLTSAQGISRRSNLPTHLHTSSGPCTHWLHSRPAHSRSETTVGMAANTQGESHIHMFFDHSIVVKLCAGTRIGPGTRRATQCVRASKVSLSCVSDRSVAALDLRSFSQNVSHLRICCRCTYTADHGPKGTRSAAVSVSAPYKLRICPV